MIDTPSRIRQSVRRLPYGRMVTSLAGLAAIVLLVLWLGFYVPHRARQRQLMADARIEDRFSSSLRVLAVSDQDARGISAGVGDGQARVARSLLSGESVTGSPALETGKSPSQDGGGRTVDDTSHAIAPRVKGAEKAPEHPASSRIEILERRAAAARRRLAITVLLLAVTIVCWALVPFTPVPWVAAVVPTVLLAVVLLLGRHAAVQGRKADAEWLARRRAERDHARKASPGDRPVRQRSAVPGAPLAPRNSKAKITGRAVRASQSSTQMIPKVTAEDIARASSRSGRQERGQGEVPVDAPGAPEHSGPQASISGRADDGVGSVMETEQDAEPVGADVVRGYVSEPRTRAGRAGKEADANPAPDDSWDPVPVPRPTYALKPQAPDREPLPLSQPIPVVPAGRSSADHDGSGTAADGADGTAARDGACGRDDAEESAGPSASWSRPSSVLPPLTQPHESDDPAQETDSETRKPARAPGDVAKPKTETLGLDLNEILARRRAAGQ